MLQVVFIAIRSVILAGGVFVITKGLGITGKSPTWSAKSKIKSKVHEMEDRDNLDNLSNEIDKVLENVSTERKFNKQTLKNACLKEIAVAAEQREIIAKLSEEMYIAVDAYKKAYMKIEERAIKVASIKNTESKTSKIIDKMKFWKLKNFKVPSFKRKSRKDDDADLAGATA